MAEIFRKHPAGYEHQIRARQLEKPYDLRHIDNRPIQIDDLPFIVVAYGLTFDSQEVPKTFTPNQISSADRPTGTRANWEDITNQIQFFEQSSIVPFISLQREMR